MINDEMSLLDFFAACAMIGLMADPQYPSNNTSPGAISPEKVIARDAYHQAESMLRKREELHGEI